MTRLLLIDNYDSFTYNLVHYFSELGAQVQVVRNDAIDVQGVRDLAPDGVVISPGPGTPHDSGVCLDVLQALGSTLPIFGVCLGHQAIGAVFGASVVRHHPVHGKTSSIYHQQKSVFRDLPSPFTATRYHSLVIDPVSVPDCLRVTATTEDGVIMGICHADYPIHGVQFHPESIASEYGHALLDNFLRICS
ncbi:MAG: aminodeoxychorismate/anthranilate synthase component II [Alphaproteobacteria bacterium]|nr:MAG: aminodeoxychorismate/anthranilate synthase component II [Alphaproteobacteria bacterium]TAF14994.1 MAG: aminodeoxychorismate/anthranilate synthase component II [Alphaproteobacteria bacterium]TAF40424.1 MAG: aminodeoxychorismate/anthranilate synthase component II [Alphaproteobacteria bacterium]TAF76630.1 MAG: aminodeoxychorismate/anthranilate synthase component II [Alphaproteobacteria bacterium]